MAKCPNRTDAGRNYLDHQKFNHQHSGRSRRCRCRRQRRFCRPQPRGGGGGGGEIVEAHDVPGSLMRYNIPNGTLIRTHPQGSLPTRIIQDDGGGCTVVFPEDAIPIPEGATTVTILAGTSLAPTESGGCGIQYGIIFPPSPSNPNLTSITLRNNLVVQLSNASVSTYAKSHGHSAPYATGTGFYCGRLYSWSEFEPGESRPLFLTAARHSLMGWVVADSSGQQRAQCAGGRPIFRPDSR